jgi:hypothetical protein
MWYNKNKTTDTPSVEGLKMFKHTEMETLVQQLQSLSECKGKIPDFKDLHKTHLTERDFDLPAEKIIKRMKQLMCLTNK